MRDVGFTGTRQGMSPSQQRQLELLLEWLQPETLHHGLEKGNRPRQRADLQAAGIAERMNSAGRCAIRLVPHPPENGTAQAMLQRNRVIAAACALLIAAPLSDLEETRSGTWMTVRCARRAGKPVVLLAR